jgi:hypothetical protein
VIVVDSSAWVEYFRDGDPSVVHKVDRCLDDNLVGIGDLIYCEVMQGIHSEQSRNSVSDLFLSLPHYEMVGFAMAERSAHNYRLLRSRGVTVRKRIDVIIGTFCAEHGLQIVHHDRDFDRMAPHIGLDIV